MPEDTGFWDSITAKRAEIAFGDDEQACLEGSQLISIETQDDTGPEESVYAYVEVNFPAFLGHIRALSLQDQERVLSYYCLKKTQDHLATIFRSTQTVASFQLRAAVKCMVALVAWGGREPSVDTMEPLLQRVGCNKLGDHNLAELVLEYSYCKSFDEVAQKHGIHRPVIRRAISHASQEMTQAKHPPAVQALGWFLFKLIDRMNPRGKGPSRRALMRAGDFAVEVPAVVGVNLVRTDDPHISSFFQSRANF